MRRYAQGPRVADDHRGGMSTKQTRSDYEVDFEHGLEDCLAFEQRAELLREHHRLCPYRLIPEESRDPDLWSNQEVLEWFTCGESSAFGWRTRQ